MWLFSGLNRLKTTHAVRFTVQTSSVQVYFKFELKSFWHRNTPPLILGQNSFKTKLYTAQNNKTTLVVLPKNILQIPVPPAVIRGRKREETLAPRKRVQMCDSDDSSSLQPSKNDFRRFWYDSERF
jgi:hypothetical protein